jgi:hypothetical protein
MPQPRRFDRDEMVRMVGLGVPKAALARLWGVSPSAIDQAWARHHNTPRAATLRAYHRDYQRAQYEAGAYGNCIDCDDAVWKGDGKTRLRCRACAIKKRAFTVRDDTLLCGKCKEWKPDEDFSFSRHKGRRGRSSLCRPCSTIERREYRHRNRIPCSICGNLCSKERRNPDRPPMCATCARRNRLK